MSWLPRRARAAAGVPADHVVTLVTRQGCHLCQSAGTQLDELAAELGFTLRVLDVDTDLRPDDPRRAGWSDLVPVVLVDGREHGFWRVDTARLRAAVGGS